MRTAQEHLQWCTERALEYYDMGSKTNAIASFISDVRKHEGTAHIIQLPMLLPLLEAEYDRGRDAFEKFMSGFAV